MRRRLLPLFLVVAGMLAGAPAASASAAPPTARLHVSRVAVGAGGGPVTVRATVHDGGTCAWSSQPKITGFAKRGPCRPAVLNRVARIPKNPFHKVRRFVFRLVVVGPHGRVTKQIAVGQLAAPRRPAATTTTRAPATTTTSAATPSPTRPCTPRSNSGTCYEPGQFCRTSDHGVTGVAGDGETIVCMDNNGWRWEPVH